MLIPVTDSFENNFWQSFWKMRKSFEQVMVNIFANTGINTLQVDLV